jgi:hypothetical protein
MSIAKVRVRTQDGGLRASRTTTRYPAVVACSSGGTAATPVLCTSSADAVAAFGYGRLTELIALYLDLSGVPVLACKAATVTAGASSSVTRDGTGTATMTVSDATAADDYSVYIKVTRAAANLAAAAAAVRVSYDGGVTYGDELAVPTSGVLALTEGSLEVTWADGTFVANDVYRFTTTSPAWDATSLAAALDALKASGVPDHEFIHIAEPCTAVNAAAVKTYLQGLEATGVYRRALLGARDQNSGESVSAWVTALSGGSPGFALFDGQFYMDVCASHIDLKHRIARGTFRRNAAYVIGPRFAWMRTRVDEAFRGLAEHPGQTRVDGRSWAIPGVERLHHDLRSLESLDTARFLGLQTHHGVDGYFPTDRSMALASSDFRTVMNSRVIVEAATQAQNLLTGYVAARLRLAAGGTLDPRDAEALDAQLTADFFAVMAPYCSSASLLSDRSADMTAGRLPGAIRVRPFGYATEIDFSLQFTRE